MRTVVAALLLAIVPQSAFAGTLYMDRSKHRPSGESGVSAAVNRHAIPEDERKSAVTGFNFYALEGQTNGIFAWYGPLPGRNGEAHAVGEWYNIGNRTKSSAYNHHRVERAANKYVRGVKVCTQDKPNTAERSIRGLKVFYASVKPDGTIVPDDDPEVWVNPTGCEKWEEKVTCPDGMLAVGIFAHKADMGFRAMGLTCAAVKVRD